MLLQNKIQDTFKHKKLVDYAIQKLKILCCVHTRSIDAYLKVYKLIKVYQ